MNILLIVFWMFHSTLSISSPDFEVGKMIPEKFTCEGENTSPAFNIGNIPEGTVSMAIIMDDPDAPGGVFDHWVLFNIIPGETIRQNTPLGIKGNNGRDATGYTGPCPPSGTHHYHFKLYALDIMLNLKEGASKKNVLDAMQGHVLASGEIVGLYSKMKNRK